MADLNPHGAPVPVGGIALRTPGLTGEATTWEASGSGFRGPEDWSTNLDDAFAAAFANEGLEEEYSVAISNLRDADTAGTGFRDASWEQPAIEVDVPAPGPEYGQLLLTMDDQGVVTWNFPVATTAGGEVTRGGATAVNTYVVQRFVPDLPTDTGDRGAISFVTGKLLKVLVFPMVEGVAGRVGDYFAHRWEQAKRPYRLRGFDPDSFTTDTVPTLDRPDWKRLGAGRALLLLHGTFSRAHTGFGSFDPSVIAELNRRYDNRVFAFDHFTVSETPNENVERLIQSLPEGARLDLDILAHSRGGLVARVLAERHSELSLGSRTIDVRRVVFAATPNQGTVLANPDHFGALIDTFTNILQFAPDNGVTETLETIITVAKHLAVGAMKGLEGLASMHPTGTFLTSLNGGPRSGNAAYHAIASDFEPTEHGWQAFARDRLTDAIFGHHGNDLVVPTDGVYQANKSGYFPIPDPLVFARTHGIAHSDYFRSQESVDKILSWLQS